MEHHAARDADRAVPAPAARLRRPTATAAFGSSRRESHDASAFYERFVPPATSPDATVRRPAHLDVVFEHDARDMGAVETGSVALVVTSPPYFAGKEYEQSLGENGVPATYFEYLALLRDVFAECARVLEPGGRIAVNVANLGRRPFRSLAGDVTDLLSGLGLLLRGEVVWWKGRAAGGSCAWGSFQSPVNPVLRDVTERVVIAGKGRFDRALAPARRRQLGLPATATVTRDEFMEATTDLWEIPPESANRVGHPAPFPVELPARLIELYTYAGDVVLDPFMGSGSTAVAAVRTGRHYLGFDTDTSYVARAEARVAEERARLADGGRVSARGPHAGTTGTTGTEGAAGTAGTTGTEGAAAAVVEARRGGRTAREAAAILLAATGFTDVRTGVRVPGAGLEVGALARDRTGGEWAFDVSGGFTTLRGGLRRSESLWRSVATASILHAARPDRPVVLLTTEAPAPGTPGQRALAAVQGPGRPVHDVIEILDPAGHGRLRRYAAGAAGPG